MHAPLPQDAAAPAAAVSPRHYTLILTALTLGGFAIGTSEFAIMGLMPRMVAELGVSEPQVGHLISAYALGVVIGAPLLALLGGNLRRKTLLLALMAFYALGNLASALGPDYHSLLLFRFIAGLPHGAYFGVAALTAVSITRPEARGKAVSLVMLGLTLAMLIGNPLATWMGQIVSWRWAFAAVTLISLVTVGMIAAFLPLDPQRPKENPMNELRAFNRLPVWQALAIGAIGFAGMFSVFSYLAPTLINVTRVDAAWIPLGLAGFGLGGVIGNMLGGWLFDRLQFRAVAVMLLWATAMLLLFPLMAQAPWSILLATVAIGLMGGMGAILQSHLMDVAGEAQTLAAASHHAAFNAANALGPWLGGMAITAGWGWTSTGPVGAATAIAGLAIYVWASRTLQCRQACPA
ncbi:MFS transporter [Xanthomonas sp. XNM01]|uniref:MFS transporter n=1 Tax=Xanthomonas sp. XNM01 TaxID=2769289 RepID=UPI00177E1114|nr:MFS transporter [Xanthomonas sp. XNM01]MBD9370981.1 MFS transporter [Xanthomonas sp. XNM01]